MLAMVVTGKLSDAERQVWDAFPTGSIVNFGTGNTEGDDPAYGEGWGPDRQVRAEVLIALLSGAVEVEPGQVGAVHLKAVRIKGKVHLPGATFKHPLRLDGCCVADGIDLSEATTRTLRLMDCHIGPISLIGAKIGGRLDFSGAHLEGKNGTALTADRLTVTGSMFCRMGFRAEGQIRLLGASIGGGLDFSGAYLDGKNGTALAADGLTVSGSMSCTEAFHARGQIRLPSASIGGQLNLSGAHLEGKNGTALTAERLTVTESMFCRTGFHTEGEISLVGASISGQLDFSGAYLDGKNGTALAADGLTVTGGMFCGEGFRAEGEIRLVGVSIGSQLSFNGAYLDGKNGTALAADGLTVSGGMFCDKEFHAKGTVRLVAAKIGTLSDEEEFWPKRLELYGLTYDDMTYLPAWKRLDWLNRSSGFNAQPYEQLAAYYRRLGYDEQARRVLLAKQRQRTRQRSIWARWWGWLQDILAGYGYAPGRALLVLAGAYLAGWLVFRSHRPSPVGPGPHPAFNAFLYTLDVLLPAPALGQANDWDPPGTGLAVAAGLHILGWLLAITVIAAITRSFSRS